MTCSTFALYAASFTKEAKQALACAESPESDTSRAKRWDTLGKFETHFNHWFKVRVPSRVRVCAYVHDSSTISVRFFFSLAMTPFPLRS